MKISQEQQILKILKSGKSLTPMDALNDPSIKSMRLGGRVHRLREQGWPIVTTMIKVGSARVASYRLAR